MKLLNFKTDGQIRLGIQTERGILDVRKVAYASGLLVPATMEQAIAEGGEGLRKLAELLKTDSPLLVETDVVYAPCVVNPEKILCVGLNYRQHGAELRMDIPKTPTLFSKFNNTLTAHHQDIRLPKTAYQFDYEAELVIVMGKTAFHVSEKDALSFVFGYTCGNDFSARDLQFLTGQWLVGKSCDGFAPVGPHIVTVDEINPDALDIRCEVNGEVRQSSNTSDMLFTCADIISYVSRYITLQPGDILFTGTPSGVIQGYPKEKQQWLKAGETVSVTIEGIGTLTNRLV